MRSGFSLLADGLGSELACCVLCEPDEVPVKMWMGAMLLWPLGCKADAARSVAYSSPNHQLRAIIIPVGKPKHEAAESRVEVRSWKGKRLCSISFASLGGEHGRGVVKASWSPDSRFFVFTTASSGGHGPWHSDAYLYSQQQNRFISFDGRGITVTSSEFHIARPSTFVGKKFTGNGDIEGVRFRVDLRELTAPGQRRHSLKR